MHIPLRVQYEYTNGYRIIFVRSYTVQVIIEKRHRHAYNMMMIVPYGLLYCEMYDNY